MSNTIRTTDDLVETKYRKDGHIATISFNQPQKHNAFTDKGAAEIAWALEDANLDNKIGVVILTGEGDRAFSSGGDVKWEDEGGAETAVIRMLTIHNAIRHCLKPVIAAVKGYAIGGGCHIAYFCDLTLAADNAIFGQVGPRVGSVADGPIPAYLVRVVGAKKAREIWFLCRRYNAQEALSMGLVNAVAPLEEFDALVKQWCDDILACSPTVLRILKASFEAEFDYARDILFHFQRLIAPDFYHSDEAHEGRLAFLEKRKPDFSKYRS